MNEQANFEISAISYKGLSVTIASGEPATLAVIDKDGNIVEAGPEVARAAWDVAIRSYRNFLMGTGHLHVLSKPTPESRN
ncbi:hypothetical protein [Burkholderia pseudomallei]|uniref:hypothetical protein n=1 Tax=Burkholderia pseudomallei TaxID=28450 RepID=UPI000978F68A|nr:hypothetical protein [Burkholderia pseudomallei]MBM5590020.1 hypothetical protein [Burkholderia pseudomallei]